MDVIREVEKDIMPVRRQMNFEVGDTVKVHYKIVEGNRERIQVFEGIVIAVDNSGMGKTFTVRKISFDVGVERIFPFYSPKIVKIEVVRKGKKRRAKLYYLRERKGKAAKLRERRYSGARLDSEIIDEPVPETPAVDTAAEEAAPEEVPAQEEASQTEEK